VDGRALSIKEAAEHFGVSERTIRRRIADGEYTTSKVQTPHGPKVLIHLGDTPDVTSDSGTVTSDVTRDVTSDNPLSTVDSETNAALLRSLELVEMQQRKIDQLGSLNTQLAGQVGFLQAKLQDAEERIRLLEAPKEPEGETPAPQPEPEQPQADRSPWWQWVRRRLSRT
jgi:excisionase family DNA binding protein